MPIATTNLWGRDPAFSLPALTDGTIMDTHAYGGSEELDYDPRNRASFLTQTALAAIVGKPLTEETIKAAGAAAKAAASPIDDMRGSIKQRKHLAAVLVERTLRAAHNRARGE